MTVHDWAAYFAVSTGIYASFAWAQRIVDPQYVRAIGKGLTAKSWTDASLAIRRAYLRWFDSVFRVSNPYSVFPTVSIRRTAMVSLGIVTLFLVIQPRFWEIAKITARSWLEVFESGWPGEKEPGEFGLLVWSISFFVVAPIFNMLFDFLSITQTRLVGSLIARYSATVAVVFVFLDAIITIYLAVALSLLVRLTWSQMNLCADYWFLGIDTPCVKSLSGAIYVFNAAFSTAFEHLIEFVRSGDVERLSKVVGLAYFDIEIEESYGTRISSSGYISTLSLAVVLTTLLTSFWLWLFLLSGFFVWLGRKYDRLRGRLSVWTSLEQNPGSFLGGVSVMIWSVIFFVHKLALTAN